MLKSVLPLIKKNHISALLSPLEFLGLGHYLFIHKVTVHTRNKCRTEVLWQLLANTGYLNSQTNADPISLKKNKTFCVTRGGQ